jgi:hypothetical protein
MLIKNVNPLGDIEIPSLRRVVSAGEVIEVQDEIAISLLEQIGNWVVDASSKKSGSDTPTTLDNEGE